MDDPAEVTLLEARSQRIDGNDAFHVDSRTFPAFVHNFKIGVVHDEPLTALAHFAIQDEFLPDGDDLANVGHVEPTEDESASHGQSGRVFHRGFKKAFLSLHETMSGVDD